MKKHLRGIHRSDTDPSLGGQRPYDHLKMLKTVLLKEWHGLSDKEMEEALSLRVDFLLFTGFDIGEATPDESTICRFRNALGRRGLDKMIFAEINSQLETAGVKVSKSKGAIVISASTRILSGANGWQSASDGAVAGVFGSGYALLREAFSSTVNKNSAKTKQN